MKHFKYLTILIYFTFVSNFFNCEAQVRSDTSLKVNRFVKKRLGTEGYYISIPRDFKITKKKGVDFYVYWISPKDTSRKDIGYSGIYFGNWPSVFEPKSIECKADSMNSLFLGQSRVWGITKCSNQFTIQTIAQIGDSYKIHAFANVKETRDLSLYLEIFKSLTK